ncbi:Ras-related protein Rab-4B [Marasmius crinis-equi]|uniref:Ras-related protein Rab-4B n=1 Tax=Marasmius crinis-equi TaxID=585013 RepID=A0ABR3FMQ0_9AGAR
MFVFRPLTPASCLPAVPVKDHSQHTIGVEFSSRTIKLGEKRIKLQLWDTAGQERFRSVTRSYYRGAAGAILVYDITNRDSFTNLSRWLADARALGSSHLVTVLVGNKSDREEERQVEWAEASRWAAENDIHFLETSSLTGDNVEAPFLLAARSILLSIESGTLDPEKAGSGVSYGDRALRRPQRKPEEENREAEQGYELDTGLSVLLILQFNTFRHLIMLITHAFRVPTHAANPYPTIRYTNASSHSNVIVRRPYTPYSS